MMNKTNNYTIESFTQYQDHSFIEYAYMHILGREPDDEGRKKYLKLLRSGEKTKTQLLCLLRFSAEGKNKQVDIPGLKVQCLIHKILHLPVIGYIFLFIKTFIQLPKFLKEMQQLKATNEKLLYTLDQLDVNFKVTSNALKTLAEITDTRASDEDIKLLYRLLLQKKDS